MMRRPAPTKRLSPALRGAVTYTSQHAQAREEIALVGALCCLAAVFQGLAMVCDVHGNPQPLSMHGFVGADSGDGKSPCFDILAREIKKFDTDFAFARKDFDKRRLAKNLQFERDIGALTREIAKLKTKDKPTAHLDEKVEAALKAASEDLYAPRFISTDSSSASLISRLRHRFQYALLGEDEGDIVLNSGAYENSELMIKLWDSMRYTFDRAHESVELQAGVTVFIAIPRDLIRELMASKAGHADLKRGKFARGIWAFPENIQGERDFDRPTPDENLIKPYHSVLRAALERYRDGLPTLLTLQLSPEARLWLRRYQKAVEHQLRQDGLFLEMPAQANKSALIALRLAGLVHLGEGYDGAISEETAKLAIELAAYFLWEYRCQFCPLTELERHAALLSDAIDSYLEDHPDSLSGIPRRHFLRNADPEIRHVKTLDPAARHLQQIGRVRLFHQARNSWMLYSWPDDEHQAPADQPWARKYGPVRPEPPKPKPFDDGMMWPGVPWPWA